MRLLLRALPASTWRYSWFLLRASPSPLPLRSTLPRPTPPRSSRLHHAVLDRRNRASKSALARRQAPDKRRQRRAVGNHEPCSGRGGSSGGLAAHITARFGGGGGGAGDRRRPRLPHLHHPDARAGGSLVPGGRGAFQACLAGPVLPQDCRFGQTTPRLPRPSRSQTACLACLRPPSRCCCCCCCCCRWSSM